MSIFHVTIKDRDVSLPMNRYTAEQFLYDLGLDTPHAEYEMELLNGSDFLLVLDSNFRELNRLAQRISEMDDYEYESFNAWVAAKDLCTVEDALRASYHLDRIEFHPGFDNDEALGGFALESDMFEEYNDLQDDVYAMLDREKVGARMREECGGMFINGGYLEVAGDISAEELPAEAPTPWIEVRFHHGDLESAWHEVPKSSHDERVIANFINCNDLDDLQMDCRSMVSQLSGIVSGADELPELRELDRALNHMSSEEIQKYKALLEVVQPGTASTALRLAEEMDYYEVELEYADPVEYAKNCTYHLFDLMEDDPLSQFIDFAGYGKAMLQQEGYEGTRYGAIFRNAMLQKHLAGPNTFYGGEFYCARTEGFPTYVCWDPDRQKVWLELSNGTAGSGILEEFAECQEKCEAWGVRHCETQEDYEKVLTELGAQPYEQLLATEDDQSFGGMGGIS